MKKKLLLFVCFFTLLNSLFAQSNGDYRSVANSDWNLPATWQRHNGTTWVAAPDYPGQNPGTLNVLIQDGNTVNCNVSPATVIGSLTLETGGTATTLNILNNITLNVTGAVLIAEPTGNVEKRIFLLGAGTILNCASITLTLGNNDNRRAFVVIGGGTVNVTGNITMGADPDRCYLQFSTGRLNVAGNITGGTIIQGTGTVNFNNGAGVNQNIPIYTYYNLHFTGGANSFYKDLTGNLSIGGDIEVTNAILRYNNFNITLATSTACRLIGNAVLQFNGTGTIITSNGFNLLDMGAGTRIELASATSNIPNFAINAIDPGSIIDVSCVCNQPSINFLNRNWGIVNFISSGTKTMVSNLNAVIANIGVGTTLATGANNITFRDNGSGNRNIFLDGTLTGTGKFIFNSGGNITVTNLNGGSNPFIFYDLEANFVNATDNLVLNKNITIANTLTLTRGRINTQSNTVALDNATETQQLVGGSASSYVYSTGAGRLRRNGFAPSLINVYDFPVGTPNHYLPVFINHNPGTDADYAVNVFEGATTNGVEGGPAVPYSLNIVNAIWNVDRPSGFGEGGIKFKWVDALEGAIFNSYTDAQIKVAKYTGTSWTEFGAAGIGGGFSTASLNESTDYFTSFSPFMVGGGLISTTLPVKFGPFTAVEKQAAVQLNWKVYSEDNVAKYIIERSSDARLFSAVGTQTTLQGAGTTYIYMDANPLAGDNFYRIKSIDISGKITYSAIIRINLDKNGNKIELYPNPVIDNVVVFQGNNLATGILTVRILNAIGQEIHRKLINHTGGSLSQTMELPSTIGKGLLIVTVIDDKGKMIFTEKVVKQ